MKKVSSQINYSKYDLTIQNLTLTIQNLTFNYSKLDLYYSKSDFNYSKLDLPPLKALVLKAKNGA